MKPIQILYDMMLEEHRRKYPMFTEGQRYIPKFKVSTANGLTRAVIEFLRLRGHQAERVSVEGRVIDGRREFTDALGCRRTMGTLKRIKSSMTRGSADISSTIAGRSVKWEVKVGKDRQSPAQKEYQAAIERAGGVYYIVRTFDEFYEKYNELIRTLGVVTT